MLSRIFFVAIMVPFIINAQWTKKQFPVKTNLLDIEFAGENIGFVTTYSDSLKGIVYKTTDGGKSWFHSYSGTFHPHRLQVINDKVIVFSDDAGNIYKSLDGGKTWFQSILANEKIHFSFINESTGWMASFINNTFSIKKTIDGGLHWQTVRSTSTDPYLQEVTDIYFADELNGWVLGIDFVYRTDDGGTTWQYLGLTGWIKTSSITFLNKNWGWITGNSFYTAKSPKIIETSDGGKTWNNSNIHQTNFDTGQIDYWFPLEKVFRVEALDSNNLYIPGFSQANDGIILRGTDPSFQFTTYWINEQTLSYKPWMIKEQLNDVEIINKDNIVAVGSNGTYLQRDTTKMLSVRFPNGGEKIYPKNVLPITWNANNLLDQKIDIYYSLDAGQKWNLITENIEVSKGVFNWRVPVAPSAFSIIKIVNKNKNLADFSDESFEIVNEQRKLKIDYPLSGDTVLTNSDIKIKWSSNYESPGKLKISFNYSNQYSIVDPLFADFNDGELIWHSPDSEMRVEISITDETNPEIVDFTSNVFISNAPQLSIIAPNKGERWQVDSVKQVKIFGRYITNFSLLLSTDNGTTWSNLNQGIYAYDNNYYQSGLNIKVPNVLSNDCRIKVVSTKSQEVYDISDSTFTITNAKSLGYYPLAIGNVWFYKYITYEGFKGVYKMLTIVKDTLLDNRKMYQFDEYTSENNHFYLTTKAYKFYAQEGNYIYEYPSPYGFTPPASERIIDLSSSPKTEIIFSRNLFSFEWFGGWTPIFIYRSFIESIGFNIYGYMGKPSWNDSKQLELVGCVIDGEKSGEVFEGIPVGIKDNFDQFPTGFSLSQNYPNPFNPETTISYSIPKSENVSLKIYDLLGREIAILVDEYKSAGTYHSTFNTLHSSLSSGVYFYRLQAGTFSETKKLVFMK